MPTVWFQFPPSFSEASLSSVLQKLQLCIEGKLTWVLWAGYLHSKWSQICDQVYILVRFFQYELTSWVLHSSGVYSAKQWQTQLNSVPVGEDALLCLLTAVLCKQTVSHHSAALVSPGLGGAGWCCAFPRLEQPPAVPYVWHSISLQWCEGSGVPGSTCHVWPCVPCWGSTLWFLFHQLGRKPSCSGHQGGVAEKWVRNRMWQLILADVTEGGSAVQQTRKKSLARSDSSLLQSTEHL